MSNYLPDNFADTLGRPIEPGEVLCRRYRVERELGRGGMGIVLLATDTTLNNRPVALKVLPNLLAADRPSIARLQIEAENYFKLAHPHIVSLRNFEQDHHRPGGAVAFLVMEYVDGPTLDDLLVDHQKNGLPWERVRPWAEQVASAIDFAHQKEILHRDIKPSNIIIDRGGEGAAYLMDFGLARQIRASVSRMSGRFADGSGTLPYMSSQQIDGKDGPFNDVYSFAMTLYEALSGHVAFPSTDDGVVLLHQIRTVQPSPLRNVPPSVDAAILRGLAKESEDRPSSCTELVAEAVGHGGSAGGWAARLWTRRDASGNRGASTTKAPSKRAQGERLTVTLQPEQVEFHFCWIPPGSFMMGSPESEKGRYANEGPQREVVFASGFWLQETQVTQAQWAVLMPEDVGTMGKSVMPNIYLPGVGANHPVYFVTWHEAREYALRLGARGEFRAVDARLRLPSESEWEYACRAGSASMYPFGASARDLDKYAWFADNSGRTRIDSAAIWENDKANYERRLVDNKCTTHPVGTLRPNAWGLHDMLGNVWEWCEDVYAVDSYTKAPTDGRPITQANDTESRVLRGGSWHVNPRNLRSAGRGRFAPGGRGSNIGFRLALDSN